MLVKRLLLKNPLSRVHASFRTCTICKVFVKSEQKKLVRISKTPVACILAKAVIGYKSGTCISTDGVQTKRYLADTQIKQ